MSALPCWRAAAALPAPQAVYLLKAERIGHGYHVLEDPELYRELLRTRMHFEVRPRRGLQASPAEREVGGPGRGPGLLCLHAAISPCSCGSGLYC